MTQKFTGIELTALSSCVPSNKVDNGYFEGLLSPKELRVFEKTVGILSRRYADKDVTALDLGFRAAENLFENSLVEKEEISCVIFLSQTSDYNIPFSSNILQHRLGLNSDILCLDINGGCAGFVQGLGTAFSLANSLKKGSNILFVVAETLSKILAKKDRSTSMLFGDGASACIVANTGSDVESFFNYFSDGENYDAIIIPDGGYRNPVSLESFREVVDVKGNARNQLNLSMDGTRVFDFTLREIAPSIRNILEFSGKSISDVDYFLLHQSNRFIIQQIASQLGVNLDKVPVNIENYGNTSGVSIPLLLTTNNDIHGSEAVLFCGYGSGLNWGAAILDVKSTTFLPLIEI